MLWLALIMCLLLAGCDRVTRPFISVNLTWGRASFKTLSQFTGTCVWALASGWLQLISFN